MNIRPATAPDTGAVLEFWATAAEDAHRPLDTDAAVRGLIKRDPNALLLALEDEAIIGTIIVGWDGWRCHLYRLAVAPERRGKGIARTLIKSAEQRFRDLGGIRSDAMVLRDNDLGTGFWSAQGYHEQPEWARWVKPL